MTAAGLNGQLPTFIRILGDSFRLRNDTTRPVPLALRTGRGVGVRVLAATYPDFV